METLTSRPPVPVHPFKGNDREGFTMARSEGDTVIEADMLLPHRKAYYLLVFVRQNQGRHWADLTSYEHRPNTIYFSEPGQILVKEEPTPFWGTHLEFTPEFVARHAGLAELPIVQNLHHGHELRLTAAEADTVEALLAQLEAEYQRPGEWQQRLLGAYLTVLLTYLSRLYTEQYAAAPPTPDQRLLRAYQAEVEARFREVHEVGAYAERLHISAGHLSEVVKAHTGRPAIKHLHERLVLEARRLLLHSQQPLKEIAYDLGFQDASYFNRFFKREAGTTPAEYRTHIRKMYQ
jgi:AraC family transcriptional activator of pobA